MSEDEFLFPKIDMLPDFIAGHLKFSFMDGFSVYNQIKMDRLHAETLLPGLLRAISTIMPYGFKNVSATY